MSREIKFTTDISNEWTLDSYKGTTYSIIAEGGELMKNFDLIDIPLSLPVKKTELNALEKLILDAAETLDAIANAFGGSSALSEKVKTKLNVIKFSSNNWSNPYLLRLSNKKIVDRGQCSAKYFYDNFLNGKSFVYNNFYGQKLKYNDIVIPFGFNDFLLLIENNYFTTFENKEGEVTSFKWKIGDDKATHSYTIREPYVTNISEKFIEVV